MVLGFEWVFFRSLVTKKLIFFTLIFLFIFCVLAVFTLVYSLHGSDCKEMSQCLLILKSGGLSGISSCSWDLHPGC